jgi:nucleoside-diphosphate-sugar epimerase
MKKKYLIFGSNGFLANELKNKLKNKTKNFYFISSKNINLTNLTSSKKLLKFKSTYNIVFFSAITPDKGNDDNTFIKNILMINNFFKFFDVKKINHFIYISSDAVYNLNDKLINENTSPQPNDLYGLMHLTREKIISSKILNTNLLILRLTMVYGKGDTHNSYGPNRFLRELKKDKKITLFGKGLDERDFIFVDDVIKIIIKSLNAKFYGIYNIASGFSYSFYQIAKLIFRVNFYKENILYIKNSNSITKRKFNINKLVKDFHFKTKALKDGLKTY